MRWVQLREKLIAPGRIVFPRLALRAESQLVDDLN